GAPSPALWLEQGLVTGLLVLVLYAGALRFDLAMVPLAVGTVSALGLIRAALRQGHLAALPGCLLGAALTFLVAWWWTSALRGPPPARLRRPPAHAAPPRTPVPPDAARQPPNDSSPGGSRCAARGIAARAQ